jgi:alcohol dehydrogenase YqhD (iron-dependent ADH family)
MAENGILKIGKVTDFQAHQIEHQLGAYTDCNHGQGLAVILPVLYRHIYKESIGQFARMAEKVWEIPADGKTQEELAAEGIEALAAFIREIGLPSSLREMGITDKSVLKKVAETCNLTAGCCKKLSREEILELLEECW